MTRDHRTDCRDSPVLMRADEKKNQIFELACYEGNYALTSMLAGARALEREQRAGGRSRR